MSAFVTIEQLVDHLDLFRGLDVVCDVTSGGRVIENRSYGIDFLEQKKNAIALWWQCALLLGNHVDTVSSSESITDVIEDNFKVCKTQYVINALMMTS